MKRFFTLLFVLCTYALFSQDKGFQFTKLYISIGLSHNPVVFKHSDKDGQYPALIANVIASLIQDHNRMWIATDHGGINLPNKTNFENDLKFAEANCNKMVWSGTPVAQGHVSSGAASAMLAKVYLYQHVAPGAYTDYTIKLSDLGVTAPGTFYVDDLGFI